MNKPRNPIIQGAGDSRKEAESSFRYDAERRLRDQHKILTAADISGEYDHLRALMTTADGKPRVITFDDIKNFRHNVAQIKKRHAAKGRFRGGIRIDQVIDFSASIDRERARRQITTAMPVSMKGAVIHFSTNASADSESNRHHVYVELMDYAAWSASPLEPKKAVEKLIKSSPIRFDCDCGRHTFWYRYIASIGGFAYGRLEDGYPKIKNPKLYGCACKHVLRVMALFKSPYMRQNLMKAIEKTRKRLTDKRDSLTPAQQEAFLQATRNESSRYKGIAQSSKARAKELMQRKSPEAKVVAKAMEKAMKKSGSRIAKASNKDKEIKRQLAEFEKNLRERSGITDETELQNYLRIREAALRKENP